MADPAFHDFEYVVIHGVSPTAYQRVLETVGRCRQRHPLRAWQTAKHSRRDHRCFAFRFVKASDPERFLEPLWKTDENSVIRAFVDRARNAYS